MKVHYFQRYHAKENVATANTMLLLSRLYKYSPEKFFNFLNDKYFADMFDPEISFTLQESNGKSVADATIMQESFKIVIETKITDWFYGDQLIRHLNSFQDQKYKFLFTIASEPMEENKRIEIEKQIEEYNQKNNVNIIHKNTTFEDLIKAISEEIDDSDYEMKSVLNDFYEYCCYDKLIPVNDSWKYLRVQKAGTTFDFNFRENLYYDNIERGFRPHDYLGLYKEKCVRAIGRICAQILAVEDENGLILEAEKGEITEERRKKILLAIKDAERYEYDLHRNKHRYFFVEQFYEMNFRKITPRAPMGTRIFDLTEYLGTEELPDTERIAELLSQKTWK